MDMIRRPLSRGVAFRCAMACALCLLSLRAAAFTDCLRSVENIFYNFDGVVTVTFTDGTVAVKKSEAQSSPTAVSRLLAMAMTAQTTGRMLKIRFPEDAYDCKTAVGDARSDILGLWLMAP